VKRDRVSALEALPRRNPSPRRARPSIRRGEDRGDGALDLSLAGIGRGRRPERIGRPARQAVARRASTATGRPKRSRATVKAPGGVRCDPGSLSLARPPPSGGSGKLTALLATSVETAKNGPVAVTVNPDGKSVYVGYEFSTTVSWYERSASNGGLALKGAVTSGPDPRVIAVSYDGKSVYVANLEDGSVSQYGRDTTTCKPTALSPATLATGDTPHGVAVRPDGSSVYVANYGGKLSRVFARNIETGKLTVLSPATVGTETLAYVANEGKQFHIAIFPLMARIQHVMCGMPTGCVSSSRKGLSSSG